MLVEHWCDRRSMVPFADQLESCRKIARSTFRCSLSSFSQFTYSTHTHTQTDARCIKCKTIFTFSWCCNWLCYIHSYKFLSYSALFFPPKRLATHTYTYIFYIDTLHKIRSIAAQWAVLMFIFCQCSSKYTHIKCIWSAGDADDATTASVSTILQCTSNES